MGPSRDPVADGVHHVFPQWWVACGLCRRGVRGTASLAPCPPPGRRLLWSPWLGGCLWFRHWLSNGAALCGVWLVGSGACPVTDAIALENVWNSPLVGRGAPPVPRGLSFAVVRSGGRPCCAVFVWFHTTHSRTPSPWAHRAGSAPSPEECPSARRAPLSGAPALPLHTVPPVSSCVLPVLWCLLLLWEALFLLLGSAVILCHFVLGGPCSFSPGQLRVLATHARRAGGTAPKQFLGSTPPGRAALAGRPPGGAVAQGVAPAAAPRPTAPTSPRRSPAPFRRGGDFRRRCCRWRWRCRRRSRPRRRRCCTRPRAGKLAVAAPPPAAPTQAPPRGRRPCKRRGGALTPHAAHGPRDTGSL